jgi:glutamate-1-semialdehyde 2,1-aminomutase
MGAMHEFLTSLDHELRVKYVGLEALWNGRAQRLNERLRAANLPVQVANLSTVWTITYSQPSRYNWMFQYYLRAAGLALSWVGSGRFIFPIDLSDDDFAAVADRVLSAAAEMHRDGWWWAGTGLTNKAIRRRVLTETLRARGLSLPSGRSARPSAGTAAPSSRA